ncbi:MAG: ABC transporter ATP-binding protein [Chloroflexi bacterium]|nr:ABC transporter ATP-binding protein [Chloroflexota bacterium]
MTQVKIENIVKRYGNVSVLRGVNLVIEQSEFFTLLGPSGCGKTTLLRTIAGFLTQDSGAIYFNGECIDGTPAHKRNTGMVFQNYAIFPHLNVFDNIAYGLKNRKFSRQEIENKVADAVHLVRLDGLERRMPRELSGGQQQRVVIGRAMVIEPRVLLMDEPLSNLDAKLRVAMRGDIRALQRKVGITTIYVTHDQEEALAISDRIAVMDAGVVQQIGKPVEVYVKPANQFVADFVGATNFLDARLVQYDAGTQRASFDAGIGSHWQAPMPGRPSGDKFKVAIRPESLAFANANTMGREASLNCAQGQISDMTFGGSVIRYLVRLENGATLLVEDHDPEQALLRQPGDRVQLVCDPARVLAFEGGGSGN